MLGDWLTTVAVVVTLYRAAGAQGPAGYVLVRVGPRLLGSFGGGIADRWDPARTVAVLSGAQAAVTVGLFAAISQGRVAPALVAVGLSQAIGAAQRPAHVAVIPRLAGDAALPRANALYLGAWSGSLLVGPALAGPLLLAVHPSTLIAIDALSFVVCAFVALSLGTSGPAPARHGGDEPSALRLLASTWADRTLRTVSLAYFGSGLMMTCASAAFADAAAHEL
ncbi:MAG TPA: hypothetical protein VFO60_04275, partial [Candidatus Dormibacteraeota bacterium]|nr:hypothetical protein [Candidatus Dormibacteraeota bacterium]